MLFIGGVYRKSASTISELAVVDYGKSVRITMASMIKPKTTIVPLKNVCLLNTIYTGVGSNHVQFIPPKIGSWWQQRKIVSQNKQILLELLDGDKKSTLGIDRDGIFSNPSSFQKLMHNK